MRRTTDAEQILVRARKMAIALSGMALIGMAMGGCQNAGSRSTERAMSLYGEGQYAEAYREAGRAHLASHERDERAALVAGLSANEMGYDSSARNWLKPLTLSDNREIAGRASAALGLQSVKHDDFSTAAIEFTRAGRLLRGEEAAQANFFAGESHRQLGHNASARLMYRLARGGAASGANEQRVIARLGPSDFTVQLGAFREHDNASQIARSNSARASRLGLGEPQIVTSTDLASGVLYLVHLGRFTTEREADVARVRMGTEAVVVAAVD